MEDLAQLSLWPDASFDGNRTHHLRTAQQARRDYHQTYLGTEQWQCRRREAIQRGKFRCANCYKERRLQIHHLSYAHLGDEQPSDIVALCRSCHERITAEERAARRSRGC